MNIFIKNNKSLISIVLLSIVSSFLRFYKLDWSQGLFSHPDEYHIISSVNQLSFPTQMHPNFFSYGTVTIYLIYFTKELLEYITSTLNFQLSTFNSFLIGRFYSALFSTLTILVVYKICKIFLTKRLSLLAAFLAAATPGLIQQAHFATPESAQIFFLFSSLLFMIKFTKQSKTLHIILASVFFGVSLGIKASSIVFLIPLIITIIIKSYPETLHSRKPVLVIKQVFKALLKFTKLALISIILATATFAIVAPYVFIDFQAFRSNLEYEGGLAAGKFPVFYTRQFINTLPVLFQATKILPYALGPCLLLFSVLGFIVTLFNITKKPKIELFIITISFLSLFIPNAFLFAKWTRFIAPTFPFFAIFACLLLQELEKKMRFISYVFGSILVVATAIWTMVFFSIYTNPDVRITASKWLEDYAKPGSSFLVEGGNMIDLPLHGNSPKTSLDFYNLENDPLIRERVVDALYASDYFLVQSRRVFYNHQRLPDLYPKTVKFYNTLFNGNLGFEKIKEFHSYPKLSFFDLYIEFPDEGAEETWSVFDHPVIRVFEKKVQLTKGDYARFLEN